MSLSKRLESAAGQRPGAQSSTTVDEAASPGTIDLGDGVAPAAIDLRAPGTDEAVADDIEVIAPAAPSVPSTDIDEADEDEEGRQWSHGLSKRLGGARVSLKQRRIERRQAKTAELRGTEGKNAISCPRCDGPARIDIKDTSRGIMHLSCDSCFKMWQQPTTESSPKGMS